MTDAELDEIRERHYREQGHCYYDGTPWPCLERRLLAAYEGLHASASRLVALYDALSRVRVTA